MDEEIGCTPPELREVAENTLNNLLPKKSREAYEKEFGNFNCWCNENNVKMQYEEEGERLADTSACAGVRADLKMCLLNSDCVKKDKRTPRECLNVDMVPTECQALRNTFMECKRSMEMQYEEEGEKLADKSACAGVRADLKMCLLNSDCVKKDKRTPRECLSIGLVPAECQALRNTFMECKRSMLDNRTRFRGRKGY